MKPEKIYYWILTLFGTLNGWAFGSSFTLLMNNDLHNFNFLIYTSCVFILWIFFGKKLVLRIYA